MSTTKNIFLFVGKSAAFALIAGVIWCSILLVVSNFSTRSESGSSSSSNSSAEQTDMYKKQLEATQVQIERAEAMQLRHQKMLEISEQQLAEQEKLQKRFAAVLDKWEKLPAK